MCQSCKFLDIKNRNGRIRDRFSKHCLGIRLKIFFQFFLGKILIYKGTLDTHLLHGDTKQIVSTSVNRAGRNKMISRFTDIKDRIEISCLTGGSQHSCHTTLQGTDLGRNRIIGRILQTGVEISVCLQIKKLSHLITGIILKRGALYDWNLTRLSLLWFIPFLNTFCLDFCLHFFLLTRFNHTKIVYFKHYLSTRIVL